MCHSVPALKAYAKAVERHTAPKLPDPDHFKTLESIERLRAKATIYRKVLGRFIVLSAFSHFECYVIDVFKEIFDFHGGVSQMADLAQERLKGKLLLSHPKKHKLQEYPAIGKESKYKKYASELTKEGYRFPSELLFAYGVRRLGKEVEALRSKDFIYVLESALGLDLNNCKEEFCKTRNLRNKIAHGRLDKVDLEIAIKTNKFLRDLAVQIDKHIVNHFLVIQEY